MQSALAGVMGEDADLLQLTRRLWLQRDQRMQPLRWRPAADIYRRPGGWLVKLELAGVAPDQVEIGVQGRRLRIRGQRRDATAHRDLDCHTLEIAYSAFERVVELPVDLEAAHIVSKVHNGMLLIDIATEPATP